MPKLHCNNSSDDLNKIQLDHMKAVLDRKMMQFESKRSYRSLAQAVCNRKDVQRVPTLSYRSSLGSRLLHIDIAYNDLKN